MFKKDDIIVELDSMIPGHYKDEYKLLMGGSLVMNGIRETTNDLDLDVSEELFDYLCRMYGKELNDITVVNGQRRMEIYTGYGEIEVYAGNFKTDSGFEVRDIIEDIRCQTLGDIVKMKRHFGRDKDFEDIVLIEKFSLNRKID